MKRIYIAGAITSLYKQGMSLEQIKDSFENTAKYLRAKEYDPVSPFELHPIPISWESAMKADIAGLVTCDAIYFRRGWEGSRGARLEFNVATGLGLEVLFE